MINAVNSLPKKANANNKMKKSPTITSDTRVIDLTVGQLMDLQAEKTKPAAPRILLTGMKEFAAFLKVSIATAHRIKKSGVIRKAISQFKKTIIIDGNLALELLKEADSPWSHKMNRRHS